MTSISEEVRVLALYGCTVTPISEDVRALGSEPSTNDSVPIPFVDNTCPDVPSVIGRVNSVKKSVKLRS